MDRRHRTSCERILPATLGKLEAEGKGGNDTVTVGTYAFDARGNGHLDDLVRLWVKAGYHPLAARGERSEAEAGSCIVHTHVAAYGGNMQTAYHNGDTILAWVREITQTNKAQNPTSRPATA